MLSLAVGGRWWPRVVRDAMAGDAGRGWWEGWSCGSAEDLDRANGIEGVKKIWLGGVVSRSRRVEFFW